MRVKFGNSKQESGLGSVLLPFEGRRASFCQAEPHVDEVIGDHSQSNPSPHAVLAPIATAVQPVPPLENADPAFAARAPALTFLE